MIIELRKLIYIPILELSQKESHLSLVQFRNSSILALSQVGNHVRKSFFLSVDNDVIVLIFRQSVWVVEQIRKAAVWTNFSQNPEPNKKFLGMQKFNFYQLIWNEGWDI